MKRPWKRNLVALAVLMFVGLAVYLNWKYADTTIAGDPGIAADAPTSANGNTEEDVSSAQEEGNAYFATARLSRQQARDAALAMLQEAADSDETENQESAGRMAESIQVLANYAMVEAQIENLVTAKGYADCVAFMADGAVSVVVSGENGGLSSGDVAKITDIVKAETGFSAQQIKIMTAN